MNWQPIETAPKDGTRIVLAKFNATPGFTELWWLTLGHWSEKWGNWNDGIEPCGLAGPNFWVSLDTLPEPPK